MASKMTADEEMCMAYGAAPDSKCIDCTRREGGYCVLTNKRRKCSDYGQACKKFIDSNRYKFVVK